MANKIKANVELWIKIFNEGNATLKDLKSQQLELSDLIYKMWQNDLISDKVRDDCYGQLQVLMNFILKMLGNGLHMEDRIK